MGVVDFSTFSSTNFIIYECSDLNYSVKHRLLKGQFTSETFYFNKLICNFIDGATLQVDELPEGQAREIIYFYCVPTMKQIIHTFRVKVQITNKLQTRKEVGWRACKRMGDVSVEFMQDRV